MSTGAREHNPHFPGLATPFLALSTQDTPCSPEPLALAQRGASQESAPARTMQVNPGDL